MNEPTPNQQAIDRLIEIMARLRAPDGCAWDREQTPATLKSQMLEECYEVIDAIDSGSSEYLTEELGDLLLHIVFQVQIARETGQFDFADVANGVADKLIRRHPHVFGDTKITDPDRIVAQWNELKKAEKPERQGALDGVPRALPALMRAEALQKKARNVGFDWPDVRGSLEKVREEVAEVTKEIESDLAFAHANEAKFVATPERRRNWVTCFSPSLILLVISSSMPRNFLPGPTTNSPAVSGPWRNELSPKERGWPSARWSNSMPRGML